LSLILRSFLFAPVYKSFSKSLLSLYNIYSCVILVPMRSHFHSVTRWKLARTRAALGTRMIVVYVWKLHDRSHVYWNISFLVDYMRRNDNKTI
jgi:hypothetical protein